MLRIRRDGFTLIELLIVVAIIGIIAALLVPNFIEALQKSKQKRTMADQHLVGGAMMAWLTDQASAAAAGATTNSISLDEWTGDATLEEIRASLVSAYIQEIPEVDGWRLPFTYKVDLDNPNSDRVFLIGSGGRDGSTPSGTYTVGGFDPTDFDQDLLWADGYFLHWPQK